MGRTRVWTTAGMAAALTLGAGGLSAQADRGPDCEGTWGRDAERVCEVRDLALERAPGRLDVDGGQNGGVRIMGTDDRGVRLEVEVWAQARSEDRAEELVRAVRVRTDGGRIRAEGPETGRRESWGVSYWIWAPRETDVRVETHNGGIRLADLEGEIEFRALNGGVTLSRLAGDVRGSTTNGGLDVELDGRAWEGRGLDVETQNGGVELDVPDGYSAQLETGTVNGRLELDFPVTVSGRIDRRVRATLGDGGAPVRVVTTNGGVRIRRR
ncbi:MAG: hypothetical protein R3E98_15780 [Gemmatimonadota bacterium]